MLDRIKTWNEYIVFLNTVDKRSIAYRHRDKIEKRLLDNANRHSKGYKQWVQHNYTPPSTSIKRKYSRTIKINSNRIRSHKHHLHIENNHNFVIYIPDWLHMLYKHDPNSWKNMDTINAIALDYWINENTYEF